MSSVNVCIIDYYDSVKFFLRLSNVDVEKKYIFITTLPSVFFFLKKRSKEVKLVSDLSPRKELNVNLENTKEFKLEILSKKECNSLAYKVHYQIHEILQKYDKCTLLTWNGSNVIGEVMRDIKARSPNVYTLFFEIANLPGKIFVDTQGVNAASSLYLKAQSANVGDEKKAQQFAIWKDDFVKSKLKNDAKPPQSLKMREVSFRHIYDFLFLTLVGYKTFPKNLALDKLLSKTNFSSPEVPRKFSFNTASNVTEYVFFPMQLSTDTQIILNSDLNNVQALRRLVDSEPGLIVVKPHPAEINIDYLLKEIKKYNGRVRLSFDNTYILLNNSQKVFVINSTLGLEAKLFNKPVHFFGRSIFQFLDLAGVQNYIQNCLVSIDFFKDDEISAKELNAIYGILNSGS